MTKKCCLTQKVPYPSAIGSIMYAMVCATLEIAHAVGVFQSFYEQQRALGCNEMDSKELARYFKRALCFKGKELSWRATSMQI